MVTLTKKHLCKKTLRYTVEYYLAIKKNEILPFPATWMDLEGIMLSVIIQTEKDKHCIICMIYMWNLKNKTN